MTLMNPLAGAILTSAQAQAPAAAEQARRPRRKPVRPPAAAPDTFEHSVEGAGGAPAVDDSPGKKRRDKPPGPPNKRAAAKDLPRLDVTV